MYGSIVPDANGDSNLSAYGQENEDQPLDPHPEDNHRCEERGWMGEKLIFILLSSNQSKGFFSYGV
ncbi:hypothetical protein CFP56_043907 [Quercus suber]|uniref:Uncharacterized protein n=1 Tax=Quercus suber TaxID=58331 RepID=A0AAW0IQ75_QUESU